NLLIENRKSEDFKIRHQNSTEEKGDSGIEQVPGTATLALETPKDAAKKGPGDKGGPSGSLGTLAGLGIGLSLVLGAENAQAMTKVEPIGVDSSGDWLTHGLLALGLGYACWSVYQAYKVASAHFGLVGTWIRSIEKLETPHEETEFAISYLEKLARHK